MNITTCLDVLGCERIDHGYHILEDPSRASRGVATTGIFFTCCPTSTAVVYGWPDLTTHPIGQMVSAGLNCMLNSDDPTMFHTDIGKEYVDLCSALEYGPECPPVVPERSRGDLAGRRGQAGDGARLLNEELDQLDQQLD